MTVRETTSSFASTLDQIAAKNLPYVSNHDRQALLRPAENLVGAAVFVGRLIRSGDAGIGTLRRWVASLDDHALGVIAHAAEGELADALGWLHRFVLSEPAARDVLRAAWPDALPSEAPGPAEPAPDNWGFLVMGARDDAESLVATLGVAAMDSEHAETASTLEGRVLGLACGLDELAERLVDFVGDAASGATADPWLSRLARLAVECWWVELVEARVGPRDTRSAENVVPVRPRGDEVRHEGGELIHVNFQRRAIVALAADDGTDDDDPDPGVTGAVVLETHPQLEIRWSERAYGARSTFVVRVALKPEAELDLSLPGAVEVVDGLGRALTPQRSDSARLCWWGEFAAEAGQLVVRVPSAEVVVAFALERP